MYPLVFSYTGDGAKNGGNNGSNYLMVQYFRNYIVRPIGSLSATSTQDSLSSSFICTANEANTMIPPPYSSAASPDGLSMSLQNYALPRSASQQAFMNNLNNVMVENHCGNAASRPRSVPNTEQSPVTVESHCRPASENFVSLFQNDEENASSRHHIGTSSSSTMATTNTTRTSSSRSHSRYRNNTVSDDDDDEEFQPATSGLNLSTNSANAMDYNDDNQLSNIYHSTDTMLSLSAAMMDTISYSRKTNDHTKLSLIQRQLEKCCEMIQQQQKQIQQTRSQFNITSIGSFESESPSEAEKRAGLSFLTSRTGSTVSSLANLNSHGSQPQVGESPSDEVKELLEQIRQLQDSCEFASDKIDEEEEGAAALIITNDNRNLRSSTNNDQEPQPGPSNAPIRSSLKRPTSFNSKRRFFNSVINRSVYSPIASNNVFASPSGLPCGSKLLKSPTTTAGVFMMKGRCMKNRAGWISKSAPTTPGTGLPSTLINDNSPLLNEQDEDAENEETEENDQNC